MNPIRPGGSCITPLPRDNCAAHPRLMHPSARASRRPCASAAARRPTKSARCRSSSPPRQVHRRRAIPSAVRSRSCPNCSDKARGQIRPTPHPARPQLHISTPRSGLLTRRSALHHARDWPSTTNRRDVGRKKPSGSCGW